MERRQRLLIVDDEAAIVNMLRDYFTMQGYACVCARNASEALAAVSASTVGAGDADEGRAVGGAPAGGGSADRAIDIVLLDVNMPGMDGFELCRRVREHLACPIIFLTARVEDADQLDGFAAGGDDYVLKPFSLAVLGGRVRAHLARSTRQAAQAQAGSQAVRIFSAITINYGTRTVTVRPSAGVGTGAASAPAPAVPLDLTRTEFDIVALLSKHPGCVYDRQQIYELVWGWDAAGDPGIVREHIRRIRRKIAEAGLASDPIGTVWGVGYQWVAS